MMEYKLVTFLILTSFYVASIFVLTKFYISYSKGFNIVAKINNRTLHTHEVPTGAGIVFSSFTVLFMFSSYLIGLLNEKIMLYLSLSALSVTLFGFIDDLFNIRASLKFLFQILSSALLFFIFYSVDSKILTDLSTTNLYLLCFICIFLLVGIMNMLNFMDGIDGLAASCTLIISWSAAVLIYLQNGITEDSFVLFFLGLSCLSFLFFNLKPALTFMGDAGSMFLGFLLGAFILKTFFEQSLNLAVWIILLSYFLGDSVPTTLYRMLFVRKWFNPHRSHAYQNLARILENHTKVTSFIVLYHIFWLIPLSVCCLLFPQKELLFIAISISPVLLFNFLYGPRLSRQ